MKKFLRSTLIFTLLSYVVQYALDFIAPLAETAQPSLTNLSDLDNLLGNPAALDALQSQFLNPADIERTIHVTIITCLAMAAWPVYRFFTGSSRSLFQTIRWGANRNFLDIQMTAPVLAGRQPLRHKPVPSIRHFTWKGENTGRKPLRQVSAFIRSDKTQMTLPLLIDGLVDPAIAEIPGQSAFILHTAFPAPEPHIAGYSTEMFWQEFGAFTLTFIHDGKRIVKTFGKATLAALIKQRIADLQRL